MMKGILKRDSNGECVGECSDIVRDAERKRQAEIDAAGVASPGAYPHLPYALTRSEPPGFLGGHI